MNQNILGELQSGLKAFGLNPIEWTVFWLKGSQFGVLGKSDPQIILAGSVIQNEQTWQWLDLELITD